MKISLSNLESARRNIQSYVSGGAGQFRQRRSYAMYWKSAIRVYHNASGDREAAFNHFLSKCQEHFSGLRNFQRNIDKYSDALERYCDSYDGTDLIFVETEKPLTLQISDDHFVTGKVPRFDMIPEGPIQYSVAFVSTGNLDLELELRSKLIQRAIAVEFMCDDEQVQIGHYSNSSSSHSFFNFTQSEVEDGIQEAVELIEQIENLTIEGEDVS